MSIVCKGCSVTRDSQEEATETLDIISHSMAQTQRLGMRLGDLLRGGELRQLEVDVIEVIGQTHDLHDQVERRARPESGTRIRPRATV